MILIILLAILLAGCAHKTPVRSVEVSKVPVGTEVPACFVKVHDSDVVGGNRWEVMQCTKK